MKVVVTGGTGTIGINLIQYLLKKNVEVTAIVRNRGKIASIFSNSQNLTIIECDLENIENLELPKKQYDVFYHMAWAGTRGNKRDDVELQFQNINYTICALKLANKIGCKTFIGTGSQAEYGEVEEKLSSNTPANPQTAYGIAKLCAGQISRIMANQIGMNHIWTRILSCYGPYDNEDTMIMQTISEMLKYHHSPEYTKAEQLWDYIYVEDVAKALYLVGKNGKNNSIYCIGSGEELPLHVYIEKIRDNINPDIKLKLGVKEYAKNQVMKLCADISNLKDDTGFEPEIKFDEGIKKTIKWYKEKMSDEEN